MFEIYHCTLPQEVNNTSSYFSLINLRWYLQDSNVRPLSMWNWHEMDIWLIPVIDFQAVTSTSILSTSRMKLMRDQWSENVEKLSSEKGHLHWSMVFNSMCKINNNNTGGGGGNKVFFFPSSLLIHVKSFSPFIILYMYLGISTLEGSKLTCYTYRSRMFCTSISVYHNIMRTFTNCIIGLALWNCYHNGPYQLVANV